MHSAAGIPGEHKNAVNSWVINAGGSRCFAPRVFSKPLLVKNLRVTLAFLSPGLADLTDRKGSSLTSGGDYELGLLALRMGWEAWYTPNIEMEHVLPACRLTDDYLKRLQMGNVESKLWLNYLPGKMPRCPRRWYLREAARKKLAAFRVNLSNVAGRSPITDGVSAEEYELRAQRLATILGIPF